MLPCHFYHLLVLSLRIVVPLDIFAFHLSKLRQEFPYYQIVQLIFVHLCLIKQRFVVCSFIQFLDVFVLLLFHPRQDNVVHFYQETPLNTHGKLSMLRTESLPVFLTHEVGLNFGDRFVNVKAPAVESALEPPNDCGL